MSAGNAWQHAGHIGQHKWYLGSNSPDVNKTENTWSPYAILRESWWLKANHGDVRVLEVVKVTWYIIKVKKLRHIKSDSKANWIFLLPLIFLSLKMSSNEKSNQTRSDPIPIGTRNRSRSLSISSASSDSASSSSPTNPQTPPSVMHSPILSYFKNQSPIKTPAFPLKRKFGTAPVFEGDYKQILLKNNRTEDFVLFAILFSRWSW